MASNVTVYGRTQDMWTDRARDLLERRRIPHAFVDLDDPAHASAETRLAAETRHHRTPYVFAGERFLGGYAELDELDRLGQLEPTLAGEGDAPSRHARIVVASRPTEFVPPALLSPPALPADGDGDPGDGAA
jgi:glutaredoxin